MSNNSDNPSVYQEAWNVGWAYCFGFEAGVARQGGVYPFGGTQAARFADYREQKVIERGRELGLFADLREDLEAFEASLS